VQPLGILRMVSLLSSLGDLPAELAFCLATGNTVTDARARLRPDRGRPIRRFRRHGHGAAFAGQEHPATAFSFGDLPGIGMTIIDGIVRTQRSRNTPPAGRVPEIVAK